MHTTKLLTIKQAQVDLEIIPLINWLNSYESVVTQYSCEGEHCEEEDEDLQLKRPYILFTCNNLIDLISILSVLEHRATVEVSWSQTKGCIEYVARFYNKKDLLACIDFVKNNSEKFKARMINGW